MQICKKPLSEEVSFISHNLLALRTIKNHLVYTFISRHVKTEQAAQELEAKTNKKPYHFKVFYEDILRVPQTF